MPDFFFDDSEHVPLFQRPELLCHTHIPKGLAGINPRTIVGADWWDNERRLAYDMNNYCCWACGIHGSQDPYEQRLEAHEAYEYDWYHKIAVFKETVALCHCCHCFIHSGRLWAQYRKLQIPREKVEYVCRSRMQLLRDRQLQPYYYAYMMEAMLDGIPESAAYYYVRDTLKIPPPPKGKLTARWTLIFNIAGEEKKAHGGY